MHAATCLSHQLWGAEAEEDSGFLTSYFSQVSQWQAQLNTWSLRNKVDSNWEHYLTSTYACTQAHIYKVRQTDSPRPLLSHTHALTRARV